MRDDGRRYRINEVIGQGGFGKVFRATLQADGFLKEVAIKLLKDSNPDADVLRRFRDEARVLALVSDRAVVGVDPPTQLDGRWAVVMEYVPGSSTSALLREHKVLPPRCAIEVVMEVARALNEVYRQPGPDGAPLRLMHRDLKPSNLQVTRSGAVKILDFGIAKADFAHREAFTTDHMAGTVGYIAPERYLGVESDKTDVYSLGVIFREFLVGRKCPAEDLVAARDAGDIRGEALKLAAEMTSFEATDRPHARDVERVCRELLRATNGPTLRDWAEEHVVLGQGLSDDELVGSTLSSITKQQTNRPALAAAAAGGMGVALIGVGALLLLGVGVGLYWARAWESSPTPATIQESVRPASAPIVAPEPEPAPQPEPETEPQPEPETAPQPEPAVQPDPVPELIAPPVRQPRPVPPAEPTPEPVPEVAPVVTHPIVWKSVPLGAKVFIDGTYIGDTPLRAPVAAGGRKVRMTLGEQSVQRSVKISKNSAPKYTWRVNSGTWQAEY